MTDADIEAIIFGNNFTGLKTNTLLIVMPHVVAFAIFAIIWIPLICCCVWPGNYKISQKNIQFVENVVSPKSKCMGSANSNGPLTFPPFYILL